MIAADSEVIYNREFSPGHFRLALFWKTPPIVPGQFVMLRVTEGLDPLLRRPFGIYNVIGAKPGRSPFRGEGIELLYRVVGKGTSILSGKRPGEKVGVMGPLGNGFPYKEAVGKGSVILAGGGMGIVPLYLLARSLKRPTVLFGARTKKDTAAARDFKDLECVLKVSTDDGSSGRKALVTELLKEEILPNSIVFACGPPKMLKYSAVISERAGALCFVSLEKSMACGIGVCLGCAVKTVHAGRPSGMRAYEMVCADGPVFDASTIDWGLF